MQSIFIQSGKNSGAIPVHGRVNGHPYKQTLVRFRGAWRFYVNMAMLKDSPRRIGEEIEVEIVFDPEHRNIDIHPMLRKALNDTPEAKKTFDGLSPSRQKEIIRYISQLKTEISIEKNVARAIQFLLGEERFIGRDKP